MIEILKACDNDRFFLAQVCRDAIELYDKIIPGSFVRQAARFENDGLSNSYEIFIIYFNNQPVGFIGSIALTVNIIYLVALYILKEYQRQGIGTEVMDIFISSLIEGGKAEVALLAHKDATWAIDFYVKNGFNIVTDEEDNVKAYADSCMDRFYLPNTVLMTKIL